MRCFQSNSSRRLSRLTRTPAMLASTLCLSAGLLSMLPLSAAADSIYIPRLGFSTFQDKVIKVQRTGQTPDATIKSDAENPTEAASSETATENTASETPATAELTEDAKAAEKAAKKALKEAEKQRKAEEKAAKKAAKDAEKLAEKEADKLEKSVKKERVKGDIYLYSLKTDRILYHAQGKDVLTGKADIKRHSELVIFDTPVNEGLYTLAVHGSGHKTETPFLVSDSIYWDALGPVARSLGNNHCPEVKGRFQAVQYCYSLKIAPEAGRSSEFSIDRYVKGGWFTDAYATQDSAFDRVAKNTNDIAEVTNILLNTYALNPEGYKFLELDSLTYKETPTPDILDEANWGLQYLQTAQNDNGSLPAGIKQPFEFRQEFELMAESPEATAMAISALTQGAKLYEKDNLRYSVSLILSAEKAWDYLSQASVASDLKFLAAATLADATGKEKYKAIAEQLKSDASTLNNTLYLMLGNRWEAGSAATATISESPSNAELAKVLLSNQHAKNIDTLRVATNGIERLFGYEEVKFTPNIDYQMEAAWRDPLAYLAYKAGEGITKMSYTLEDKKILSRYKGNLPEETLKNIEEQEDKAKALFKKGFKALNLPLKERAYLTYTLGLANEQLALWESIKDPEGKLRPKNKEDMLEQPLPLAKPDENYKGLPEEQH